jgi:hypothetical protein
MRSVYRVALSENQGHSGLAFVTPANFLHRRRVPDFCRLERSLKRPIIRNQVQRRRRMPHRPQEPRYLPAMVRRVIHYVQ